MESNSKKDFDQAQDLPEANTTENLSSGNESQNSPNTATEDNQIALPKQLTKRKFNLFWNLFLIVMIAVGVFVMAMFATNVGEGEIPEFSTVFNNVDVTFVLVAVGVLFLFILLDILRYYIVSRAVVGKAHLAVCTKVMFLGRYYDNITPFSTGGQPVQIYYLYKKGYSGGSSTAIVTIRFFAGMFAWLLVSFCFMAFNSQALKTVTDPVQYEFYRIFAWIGWSVTALLLVSIVLFVIAPKATNRIAAGFVKLASSLKIVKNQQGAMRKTVNLMTDFRSSVRLMSKKPFSFLVLLLVCVFEWIVTSVFPYFIMLALFPGSIDLSLSTAASVITLSFYATFSVAIVPTPGSSGFVESAVLLAFGGIINNTFWVVFIWRFCVYYIYILIGIGISIFELIRNAVREKRKI